MFSMAQFLELLTPYLEESCLLTCHHKHSPVFFLFHTFDLKPFLIVLDIEQSLLYPNQIELEVVVKQICEVVHFEIELVP